MAAFVTLINEERKELMFWCPGCKGCHSIRYGPGGWAWDGDRDKPTISPSILVNQGRACPDMPLCHSYVENGRIRFLGDCTHEMKGQTAELQPF